MQFFQRTAAALALVVALSAAPAQATETQAQINANLVRILTTQAHVASSDVLYLAKHITLVKLYDTAAHLLAATPDEGSIGYALDTHVLYYKNNSAWVSFSAPTFSGAVTVTGALYANGGLDRSTAAGLAIGATNATSVTITPATTITGAATLSSTLAVSGVSTLAGAVCPSTIDTGTGAAITTATSCGLFVAAASTDAVTTFVLPAASTKAFYCFALGSSSLGSNRELDVATPSGSDLIIGTTTAAGGAGIATTAGASHGIKNTHATAVRGNSTCLQADGTNTWYMTSLSGTWAAF